MGGGAGFAVLGSWVRKFAIATDAKCSQYDVSDLSPPETVTPPSLLIYPLAP